ncbi:nitrous oxide reductase family maturation protein NosD [Thermoproteota archaeon]
MRWGVFLVILVLLSTAVAAYETSFPVKFDDDYFYEWDPKMIESREITNDEGDCIHIEKSEWVVIKGNHIHDCQATGDRGMDGYAIYIEDVDNLIIENNVIENSHRGIYLVNVNHVIIRNNNQTGTYRDAVFSVRNGDDIEIYDNYAKDNGAQEVVLSVTEGVGEPDGRLQGIVLWQTSNAEIYGNTVINSSSDGIGIAGATKEDPTSRSHNFQIYDNILIENGEQGIWLEGAQDGEIYDNQILRNKARPGFGGGSSGIMLQYDVQNFEIHDNTIQDNDVCGILIQNSPNNFIYANTITGNFDGGVCLDGETVSLPEYTFVSNMNNKIHRNILKDNKRGNINILSGENDDTELFYNSFDTAEQESIQSRGKESWKDELILQENTYKEENIDVEDIEDIEEETSAAEDSEEDLEEEPLQDAELITTPEDAEGNPLVAYSLLTLFFVILVVAIVLFSVRRSIKKK